jgi:hypothetical protein
MNLAAGLTTQASASTQRVAAQTAALALDLRAGSSTAASGHQAFTVAALAINLSGSSAQAGPGKLAATLSPLVINLNPSSSGTSSSSRISMTTSPLIMTLK